MARNSIFNRTFERKPKRSTFDLSHKKLLTTEFGKLTPTLCMEVLPGDVIDLKTVIGAKTAPMVFPLMDDVNIFTHYFWVPNRIHFQNDKKGVYEQFVTNNTESGTHPIPDANLVLPRIESGYVNSTDTWTTVYAGGTRWNHSYYGDLCGPGSLADYLGVPPRFWIPDGNVDPNNPGGPKYPYPRPDHTEYISAMPFLAYQRIWNDFYRDENTSHSLFDNSGGTSGVLGIYQMNRLYDWQPVTHWPTSITAQLLSCRYRSFEKDYFSTCLPWLNKTARPVVGAPFDIGILRFANKLQELLEKSARSGTRYPEWLLSVFGVRPPDGIIDRPQYLGGGMQGLNVSTVLNTSEVDALNPQGNQSGYAGSHGYAGFKHKFTEHGYILGITSIMPRTSYVDGIPKNLSRLVWSDFYLPELQNVGEQIVFKKEYSFAPYLKCKPNDTYGYQQRYADYKHINSSVHGDFRTTMSNFTTCRRFPPLNTNGIGTQLVNPGAWYATPISLQFDAHVLAGDIPKLNQIFAGGNAGVSFMGNFWLDVRNKIKATRPMHYTPNPTLF